MPFSFCEKSDSGDSLDSANKVNLIDIYYFLFIRSLQFIHTLHRQRKYSIFWVIPMHFYIFQLTARIVLGNIYSSRFTYNYICFHKTNNKNHERFYRKIQRSIRNGDA